MPVNRNDICKLHISKAQILTCIQKALSVGFIDNLRNRHPNVQFDSKLRGYIGEIAITTWLKKFGIQPEISNTFNSKSNMDVDLMMTVLGKPQKIEIKTSLIPDNDKSLINALQNRDIKLIKRGNKTISELESDVHIQVFFNQIARKKDRWLLKQSIDFENPDVESIYYKTAAYRYQKDIFLVGWTHKQALEILHSPKEMVWSFKGAQRKFWRCNIAKDAFAPITLIPFLKS